MCGVFGAVTPGTDAARIASFGLFALQHRGQESAGLAVSDGDQLMVYKDLGLIAQVLDDRRLPSLRGHLAVAHCRYSTTGSTRWENAQPTFRLGSTPGDRDRAQRESRQHPRPARPPPRRSRAAHGEHRHGAPHGAHRRRSLGRRRRRPHPRPSDRARRVQPRRARPDAGHRRPGSPRLPAARPRSRRAGAPRRGGPGGARPRR